MLEIQPIDFAQVLGQHVGLLLHKATLTLQRR
jgi:hypothetical protein